MISIGGGNPFKSVNPMKMMGQAAKTAAPMLANKMMPGSGGLVSNLTNRSSQAGAPNPTRMLSQQAPLAGLNGAGGTSILSILNSQNA